MIDAVWLHVLQRLPADYYDSIAIVTTTGTELVVQQVFKLERDFMVIRARTSGTMDSGRTSIVAYAQIDFIAFNRKMTEEEVGALFKDPVPEFAAPQQVAYQPVPHQPVAVGPVSVPAPPKPVARPIAAPEPPPIPVAEIAEPATPAAPETPAAKPGQISKTILLARLRERLAEKTR